MKDIYRKAYTQQKSNAKMRGIEFELSFDEWKAIWEWSGKLEQRGRGSDKYCMARIGDIGPYALCNVFITQNSNNVSSANIGKLVSLETRKKRSDALTGKSKKWMQGALNPMHRPDVKMKMSAKISGANHYAARGIRTPYGEFETARAASEALGINKSTIEWRAQREKLGFAYIA